MIEKVVHRIYHLTFPNNEDYVGSTSQILRKRYTGYRSAARISKSPICQISLKYKFKEVRMIEVDRIEGPMFDPKIKMLEEKWIKKLTPTLNTFSAYRTEEEERIMTKEYQKDYYKTPKGKKFLTINSARRNIKHFTKLNRPDMVSKWEGRLKERLL